MGLCRKYGKLILHNISTHSMEHNYIVFLFIMKIFEIVKYITDGFIE